MVELRLYSYGPLTLVKTPTHDVEIGPDVFIAVEGVGTFEGISVERKVSKLLAEGKDLDKVARKIHRESTRRGHASITTSLQLQLEATECSRALSLLLVSPPFGSYLQESQRRAKVDKDSIIEPAELSGDMKNLYKQTSNELVEGYLKLVEEGVSLEDARYVLPLGTKTSLFISSSLENYIPLIQLCSIDGWSDYIPFEVGDFVEKFTAIVRKIAPILLETRLQFKNRLATYPFPNLYKPKDPLMENIISRNGYPDEPLLLNFFSLAVEDVDLVDFLSKQEKEVYDSVNPMVVAVTLEPMSLVAYHQAIRHRTVPTSVESLYTAVERALRNIHSNIVIPPSIRKDEEKRSEFASLVAKGLQTYEELLRNGCKPSTAALIIPQALKIYTVRLYNGFNLLHPSGFIATRTCSYAQWEERGIAYKIMHDVTKKAPVLSKLIGEKCRHLGYCPERDWCPIILKYHLYSDELHKRFWESG